MTNTRTYDLAGRRASIQSITLRALTGADYYAALERAEGPDQRRVTGLDVKTEAIADAIAEVDGAAVPRPFNAWSSWGARTGAFVGRAYGDLNELTPDEIFALDIMAGPTFDLTDLDLDVAKVTFREVPTRAELDAITAAASSPLGRGARMAHVVCGSVVDADGAPLTPAGFLSMSVRTTQALEYLHGRTNSVSADELADFVKAAHGPETAAAGGAQP